MHALTRSAMSSAKRFAARFVRDDSGATAIEYCIVSVFLSAGVIFVVGDIGAVLVGFFESVSAGF